MTYPPGWSEILAAQQVPCPCDESNPACSAQETRKNYALVPLCPRGGPVGRETSLYGTPSGHAPQSYKRAHRGTPLHRDCVDEKQKGGARATGRRCAPQSHQAAEHPPEPCEEDGGAASTSLQRPTYHSRAQASACRNGCSSLSGPIHVFWMRISRCSWTPMKPQIFCK